MASPSEGAPALKYGYVNTVTTSPGEVKGLIKENGKALITSLINYLIHSIYIFKDWDELNKILYQILIFRIYFL